MQVNPSSQVALFFFATNVAAKYWGLSALSFNVAHFSDKCRSVCSHLMYFLATNVTAKYWRLSELPFSVSNFSNKCPSVCDFYQTLSLVWWGIQGTHLSSHVMFFFATNVAAKCWGLSELPFSVLHFSDKCRSVCDSYQTYMYYFIVWYLLELPSDIVYLRDICRSVVTPIKAII